MRVASHSKELAGRKVLVVEDEMLVAIDYCERLAEAGAQILGPYTSVTQALKCVDSSDVDVAVLDYALSDQTSDPLQTALERRGIPFVVVSAYPRVLVRRNPQQEVLSKPISPDVLCKSVKEACR
jgi:DNA-binding NtrC family response regulator